jgi:hypothetical protein
MTPIDFIMKNLYTQLIDTLIEWGMKWDWDILHSIEERMEPIELWTPISTPPTDIGQYLVCDAYLPNAVAVSIWYYNRMGWDKKSYTHWMNLPITPK